MVAIIVNEEARITRAVEDTASEVIRHTRDSAGLFNSAHEGYAFIAEKMDKLKEQVWLNQKKRHPLEVRDAAIRVAAMSVRFVAEVVGAEQTDSVTALDRALREVQRARELGFGPARSAHEGYAIIAEEADELKAHVWTNDRTRNEVEMHKEAVQVAAMALRFAAEAESEEWVRR